MPMVEVTRRVIKHLSSPASVTLSDLPNSSLLTSCTHKHNGDFKQLRNEKLVIESEIHLVTCVLFLKENSLVLQFSVNGTQA